MNSPAEKFAVLVVEDQPLILDNMIDELEDAAFKVFGAASAQEACALLDRHSSCIGAAFLDIDLGPGDDGFCVARYARRLHPGIRVIYTSGGVRSGLTAERVSDSAFVPKPYLPSQIGAMLKSMLRPH